MDVERGEVLIARKYTYGSIRCQTSPSCRLQGLSVPLPACRQTGIGGPPQADSSLPRKSWMRLWRAVRLWWIENRKALVLSRERCKTECLAPNGARLRRVIPVKTGIHHSAHFRRGGPLSRERRD